MLTFFRTVYIAIRGIFSRPSVVKPPKKLPELLKERRVQGLSLKVGKNPGN